VFKRLTRRLALPALFMMKSHDMLRWRE
jgi:hypothetical protein